MYICTSIISFHLRVNYVEVHILPLQRKCDESANSEMKRVQQMRTHAPEFSKGITLVTIKLKNRLIRTAKNL
jgi:hypothetical protein